MPDSWGAHRGSGLGGKGTELPGRNCYESQCQLCKIKDPDETKAQSWCWEASAAMALRETIGTRDWVSTGDFTVQSWKGGVLSWEECWFGDREGPVSL